jgi:SAP domain
MEVEKINQFEEYTTTVQDKKDDKKVEPKPKRVRKPVEKKKDGPDITYDNFIKKTINISSFKLPELKEALKKHNLKISGKKEVLVERLDKHFNHTLRAQKIQRVFRGWIIRNLMKMKGPGLKNPGVCTNDKDFVTMEPLKEIPLSNFYSYKDSKDFIYGFDIASLMHIIKSNSKLQNPYNREKINQQMIDQIKKVYRHTFLAFPEFRNENQPLQNPAQMSNRNGRTNQARANQTNRNVNNVNSINYAMNAAMISNRNRLTEIRRKTSNERINDLFMEIDALGNYTQSAWFSNLDIRGYIRLYRCLYEIWNYRSQLTFEVRHQICPTPGPFDGIFPRVVYHDDLTLEQIKVGCLTAFENMVFLGINDDSRKLGAFHALSALTIVSAGARQAMPWLYDSVA